MWPVLVCARAHARSYVTLTVAMSHAAWGGGVTMHLPPPSTTNERRLALFQAYNHIPHGVRTTGADGGVGGAGSLSKR